MSRTSFEGFMRVLASGEEDPEAVVDEIMIAKQVEEVFDA